MIMIALTLLAGTFLSGFAVMVFELWNAPEGYENQGGFHGKPGNSREADIFLPKPAAAVSGRIWEIAD